jgi:hypothetical protein
MYSMGTGISEHASIHTLFSTINSSVVHRASPIIWIGVCLSDFNSIGRGGDPEIEALMLGNDGESVYQNGWGMARSVPSSIIA